MNIEATTIIPAILLIIWLYIVYKTFRRYKITFYISVLLFSGLVVWRFVIKDIELIDKMLLAEGILWFIVFIIPIRKMFLSKCGKCGSTEIKRVEAIEINRKVLSKPFEIEDGTNEDGSIKFKKVQKKYFIKAKDITMECETCKHRWMYTTNTEEVHKEVGLIDYRSQE